MTLLGILVCCGALLAKKLRRSTEDSEDHAYESIDSINIGQEHTNTMETALTGDTHPDAAILTSSNQAYGRPIKKVEDHFYTNVNLLKTTTTSDETRPPEPATEGVSFGEEEAAISSTLVSPETAESPMDVSHKAAVPSMDRDTSPEAAIPPIDKSPEAAVHPIDKSHEAVVNITPEVCPIMTSSNPAYGCAMEKVNKDHASNLFEATMLFTAGDGTHTYRPRETLV